MSDIFTGRTAMVTGAGRGLGRALAFGLADAGANVVLLARSADQLEATRAALADRGAGDDRVLVIAADLVDEAKRDEATAAALAQRHIDILINNAGTVEPLGATAEISSSNLRAAYELNVIAPAALTAAVLPGMVRRGWGRIVNLSSGVVSYPGSMVRGNAYTATKTALEAHTVNLAAELRGTGVTANVYRPGTVDTSMQEWVRTQDPERIGTALHTEFNRFAAENELIAPERSAAALLARLDSEDSGAVWSVSDPGVTTRA
jgi:NAD(P)-dependent dehydrogenase (short-subunit alcohol dehydrogenase family)